MQDEVFSSQMKTRWSIDLGTRTRSWITNRIILEIKVFLDLTTKTFSVIYDEATFTTLNCYYSKSSAKQGLSFKIFSNIYKQINLFCTNFEVPSIISVFWNKFFLLKTCLLDSSWFSFPFQNISFRFIKPLIFKRSDDLPDSYILLDTL